MTVLIIGNKLDSNTKSRQSVVIETATGQFVEARRSTRIKVTPAVNEESIDVDVDSDVGNLKPTENKLATTKSATKLATKPATKPTKRKYTKKAT